MQAIAIHKKRILALLLLLILCAVHICSPATLKDQLRWRQDQEALLQRYDGVSLAQAEDELLRLTDGGTNITMEYSPVLAQVRYQRSYPDYLAEIRSRVKNMSAVSIFSGSAESRTNIRKTAADFSRVEDVRLTLGHDNPVNAVLQHDLSDVLLTAYILLVVYAFLAERRRGLWNMVCASPNGRKALAIRRLAVLMLEAICGGVLFTAVELICAYTVHGGWGELTRTAQSVELLKKWTLPLAMWQLWALYALLRAAFAFILGCFAWLLMESVSDRRLVLPVWAAAVAIECGLGRLPERSLLHTVNLFTYLHPRKMLLEYRNIPIFSHPFGQIPLLLSVGAVWCAFSVACILRIYHCRKPVEGFVWLDKIFGVIGRIFAPFAHHCSLLLHELYRNLAAGCGWLITAGALLAAVLLAPPSASASDQLVSTTLESYYRQSQGPVGKQTLDYLASRQARLDARCADLDVLNAQYCAGKISQGDYSYALSRSSELGEERNALVQYRTHLEALEEIPGSYILPHWVYAMLFGVSGSQSRLCLLIAAVAVVLLLTTQAGTERRTGMLRTRRATPRGRRDTLLQRHAAAWMATALLSGLIWGAYFAILWTDYGGLPFLGAPVRCLQYFGHIQWNISILGFYLLLSAARTMGLCLLASATLAVTEMGAVYGNRNKKPHQALRRKLRAG